VQSENFKAETSLVNRYLIQAAILSLLVFCATASALEPNEILVIVNSDISASVELGEYYCRQRNIPKDNILALSLGKTLADSISRDDYDKNIAEPVRKRIIDSKPGKQIRCLLTTYGVPYKVGPRGPLKDQQENLKKLQAAAGQYEKQLNDVNQTDGNANVKKELIRIKAEIDWINGKETAAAVDNELSMVLFGPYELYRWQPNQWNRHYKSKNGLILTVMVSRLDGPSPQIARGLIDKAMSAEKNGLHGFAYIDSRGIPDDKQPASYGYYDQKIRNLAVLLRFRTNLPVREERTTNLFEPNSCPQTAIYCGWYSLKKYIDSFDFVDGAIGAHIASFEAIDLRDPNSTEWVPSMLVHGVTATFGPVAEPYLSAFPEPEEFFLELIEGKCLVEAFYRSQPFCSWQMMLIGDPLYKPFAKGS
jgi:uncharacterized protein (TIGR03790 family)